ncbi:MAG TPA: ABC transporter permease [Thermomicrobiales bacterium]|nr:ABC transporter permease [Thermomicrobiales bacterium]
MSRVIEAVPMPRRWSTARENALQAGLQLIGIGAVYVIIVIFFSFATEHFFTYSNGINVLTNVTVIGIVAIGQTIAIISGGFDLSVSGVVPLGAVSFAILTNAGWPVTLAIMMVLLIGASVGVVNGLVVTIVGINPLIATLGTLSITSGLAYTLSKGVTIPFQNRGAGVLADKTAGGISYYVLLLLFLSIVGFVMLRYTVFGRMLYAIGGNREASRLAGMRVNLVTVLVYVTCSALAALAGVVVASQLLAGSATVGSQAALQSIAAVILGGAALTGGVGGIPGTLIGVLVLGTVSNGMALMQVPAFYQQIATGSILLLAVAFGRLRNILVGEQS